MVLKTGNLRQGKVLKSGELCEAHLLVFRRPIMLHQLHHHHTWMVKGSLGDLCYKNWKKSMLYIFMIWSVFFSYILIPSLGVGDFSLPTLGETQTLIQLVTAPKTSLLQYREGLAATRGDPVKSLKLPNPAGTFISVN